MDEQTLRELDERYLRVDNAGPVIQSMQQLTAMMIGFREQLSGFIASTDQQFDRLDQRMSRLDQRMSRLEADVHDIKEHVGMGKPRH